MTEDRLSLRDHFLAQAGWGDAVRHPLPGDASFRRYVRLERNGTTAMLMDAPPPQEDVRPFVAIGRRLTGMGYSAPLIHAADETNGFLLLEDLGDRTYTRALAAGADETALYVGAIDLLIDLHRRGPGIAEGIAPYDAAVLHRELTVFTDWYLPAATGKPATEAFVAGYRQQWDALLADLTPVPATLVLRDYHVDNLMQLDRPGLAGVGLLDFQDALAGPVVYDLVSLIADARRDVSPKLGAMLMDRYLAAFPEWDRALLTSAAAIISAQRLLKILGIFTRLKLRDGKGHYLVHIPRLWRLLDCELAHPALQGFARWLADAIPATARRLPQEIAA